MTQKNKKKSRVTLVAKALSGDIAQISCQNKVKVEFTENDPFGVKWQPALTTWLCYNLVENENNSAGCPGEPPGVTDDAHSPYSESGLLSCFRPISDRKLHFSLLSSENTTDDAFICDLKLNTSRIRLQTRKSTRAMSCLRRTR